MNKRIEVPDITVQSRMYIFNPTPYEIEYGSEIESIYVVEGSFDGFLELNPDAPLKTFNPDAIMAKLPEYVEFITEAANSVSNPELVSVLYNAGLCESDEYVTQGELRMLVNRQFGDIFKNDTLLESFDEFKYCTNITKLPDGAFSGCSNLGSITLPESIYKLGNGIFNDCPMLDSIKIDSNNATYADYGCNAIFDIQSKSLIEGCSSSEIPEDCDTIAENAFAGTGIEEAIIPDNIKSIKENAFENCEDLETLSIGSNVEDITTGSFAGCSSLSTISVNEDNPTYDSRDDSNAVIETATDSIVVGCVNTTIPDTVLRIAPKAFKGQSSMVTFTLPEQIESVGSEAFSDCTSLDTFTVESETPSELGADAFENVDSSFKIMVPKNTADIYKEASGWSEYADVIEEPITYSVVLTILRTSTGSSALFNNNCLSYVSKITVNGVEQQTVTSSVSLPSGRNIVKLTLNDPTTIPDSMFTSTDARFIEILDGVTTIGSNCFNQGTTFAIILGKDVTSIGANQFPSWSGASVTIHALTPPTISNSTYGTNWNHKIYVPPTAYDAYKAASVWSVLHVYKDDGTLATFNIADTTQPVRIRYSDKELYKMVIDDTVEFTHDYLPEYYTFSTTGQHTVRYYTLDAEAIPEDLLRTTPITTVHIQDGCQNYGGHSFYQCTSLTTVVMSILRNDEKKTEIGNSAFTGCTSLSSINIEQTNVETIRDYAFQNCTSLNINTLPSTVTSIPQYAFSGCSSITTFTLKSGVTSIGNYAFYNCSSLNLIYAERSTPPSLGSNALSGQASGRKIYVPTASLTQYKTASGWSNYANDITVEYDIVVSITPLYTTSTTSLLYSDAILPYIKVQEIDGVKQTTPVSSYQFSTTGAHTVKYKLFDSTQIPAEMFRGIAFLRNTVELSPEITTINDGAFRQTSFNSINLDNITSIGNYAFYGCNNYRNIILSSSLTSIGNNGFYSGSGQSKTVKIYASTPPTAGTTIFGSTLDKIIVLPGKKAVYDVASGWSDYSAKIEEMVAIDAIYDVTSTSSYTTLLTSYNLFNPQSVIDTIVIDDGTTYINPTIKAHMFNTLGDHKVSFIMKNNNTIPDYMFSDVTALKSLDIPNTVTTIGYRSLRGTAKYKHPVFPDSVTSIGIEAFVGAGLESIQFPNNANFTTISQGQFSDCTSLLELIFPDSITSFGAYTVQRCTSLSKIVIPAGVSNLNNSSSFVGLTALETLVIKRTTPPTCSNSQFTNIPATCKLYVPDESVSTYEAHSYWGVKFANNIYPMSDLEPSAGATVEMSVRSTNGSSATQLMYAGMSSYVSKLEIDGVEESTVVESKVLTQGLHRIKYTLTDNTTIPENMFRGITAFTDPDNMLIIADTVTTIGPSAFRSCTNLSHILIPDSVTSIGSYSFYECSINYAVFGSGITSLGESIFSTGEDAPYIGATAIYITMKSAVPSTLPQTNPFANIADLYVMPEYLSDYESSAFVTDYIYNVYSMSTDIQLTIDPTIGRGSDNMVTIMNEDMSSYVRLMELNNTRVQPADELQITGSSPVTIKIYLKDDRYIPDGMFSGLTNITACTTASVRLMIIGESAFEGCSNLTQLDKLYTYDDEAVLIIGDKAFRQTGIQSVITPVNTIKIGASAFAGCTDLTDVQLAGNYDGIDGMLDSIGNSAFNGCTSLTEVYVYQLGVPTLGTNVFSNNAVDRVIYVPEGSLEDFQTDWSAYSSVLQEFQMHPEEP